MSTSVVREERRGLLACAAAAALTASGAVTTDLPWTATVLPHVASIEATSVGPDGTVLFHIAVPPTTVAEGTDGDPRKSDAHLPPEIAAIVHPLDLADFVRELAAAADRAGRIVVRLSPPRKSRGGRATGRDGEG